MNKHYSSYCFGVIGTFVFAFSMFVNSVSAQTQTQTPAAISQVPKTGTTTSHIVATVNINNAKIVSQSGNTFNISFDISNRVGIQSGIKYGLKLVDPSTHNVVDEYVYSEIINLGEGQSVHKTATYAPPTALSGKYDLWLTSGNYSGLIFSNVRLGAVTLSANATYIKILPETCYLTVKGEVGGKHYKPSQNIDISDTETLVANCGISSTFAKPVEVIANFETNINNAFGDNITSISDMNKTVSLNKGKSTISFELPKMTKPATYEATLSLVNVDDSSISNAIKFNYTLHGQGAIIRNVVFDKDSYVTNDIANLQIFWLLSSGTFPGSRLTKVTAVSPISLFVGITSDGVNCGTSQNQQIFPNKAVLNIPVKISNDCGKPVAKIILVKTDSSGALTVLDSKNIQGIDRANITDKTKSGAGWNPIAFTIILIISILLLALAYYLHRNNIHHKVIQIVFFVGIISTAIFFGTNKVSADTVVSDYLYVVGSCSDISSIRIGTCWDWDFYEYWETSLSNNSFAPGEQMSVTSLTYGGSPGSIAIGGAQIDNIEPKVYIVDFPQYESTVTKIFTAPSTPGEHHLYATFYGRDSSMGKDIKAMGYGNLPFTVTTPVIPPVTEVNLGVTIQGTGSGAVTSPAGGGLNCTSSTCSITVDSGTSVTVTATENPNSIFGGWGGVCSGTNPVCTVNMDVSRSVIATFYAKPTVEIIDNPPPPPPLPPTGGGDDPPPPLPPTGGGDDPVVGGGDPAIQMWLNNDSKKEQATMTIKVGKDAPINWKYNDNENYSYCKGRVDGGSPISEISDAIPHDNSSAFILSSTFLPLGSHKFSLTCYMANSTAVTAKAGFSSATTLQINVIKTSIDEY